MNFYYDPVNAATVAAYVNYICPVIGAQEAMEAIDPAMVTNEAIFPTDETLSRVQTFMLLDGAQSANYEEQFQALAGA
jgi:spermidine/putrescine transport system substrate-binding protein